MLLFADDTNLSDVDKDLNILINRFVNKKLKVFLESFCLYTSKSLFEIFLNLFRNILNKNKSFRVRSIFFRVTFYFLTTIFHM